MQLTDAQMEEFVSFYISNKENIDPASDIGLCLYSIRACPNCRTMTKRPSHVCTSHPSPFIFVRCSPKIRNTLVLYVKTVIAPGAGGACAHGPLYVSISIQTQLLALISLDMPCKSCPPPDFVCLFLFFVQC